MTGGRGGRIVNLTEPGRPPARDCPVPPGHRLKLPTERGAQLRTHLEDVNLAIAAAGLDEDGVDAPLVGLLRSSAMKIDRAGDDGPSDRVLAVFNSAIGRLDRKVLEQKRAAAKLPSPPEAGAAEPSAPAQLHAVEESALDRLRRKKAAGR